MADSDGDLVSNVKIDGTQKTADDLKKMADEGVAAFERLAKAADNAANEIAGASDKIATGHKKIEDSAPSDTPSTRIALITESITDLKTAVSNSISSVTSFAFKIEAIGLAGIAAVTGIAKFASSATKAFRDIGDSSKDAVRNQQAVNQAQLEGQKQSIAYSTNADKLGQQLRAGKINWAEYGQAVKELSIEFDNNRFAQLKLAEVELEAKKKNDAALRAEQQRKALAELTKAYGGPLTASLIALGNTYDKLHQQVVDAFSPALALLVDAIGGVIDRNRGAITSFVNDTAKALSDFIKNNGTEIEAFLSTMADVVKGVGQIILNVIVPAFNALTVVAKFLAEKINDIFGTKLTAGTLIAAAAIIFFTGAIGAVVSVIGVVFALVSSIITIFGSWGAIIAVLIIALVALAAAINWTKLIKDVQDAFNAVIQFFTDLAAQISDFFTTLWGDTKQGATDAAQWVIDKWNAVIAFFTSIPDVISQFFTDLWERVKASAQSAFDSIQATVQGWVDTVKSKLQPILDAINSIKQFFASGAGSDAGAGGAPALAGGGQVRGEGTTTSDSIWARLSDKEFVMRARAVAKYGLNFMQAINSGQLDLGRMLGYWAGGLVQSVQGNQAPKLAYASGGSVNTHASRVLNLTVGGEQFNGLIMPEDVADKMTKFAVGRQSNSAGRKPSWVGGRR